MAKKKANKKKKNASDIKRILLLVFGSAAVVSLLFIAGYLFDYLAGSFTSASSPDRFSILEMGEDIGEPGDNASKKDNTFLNKNKYSFFDTLSEKEEEKAQIDINREEALRSHRGPKPVTKTEEQVQKPAKSSSLYAIQLGSFKSFDAANTLCDKYISKGYKAYIVSAEMPGKGTMYRVRIGRFIGINEAQEFSSEFEKKEKVSAFITSK
jgi:hypothetical protein